MSENVADARSDRVLRAGVTVAVVMTAIQTVVHLANIVVFERRFALLDAESDISLWAWASTAVEAAAAGFAALLAYARPRPRPSWRLILVAGLLAFLSADDILALHERISIDQLGPIPHASRLIWPLVFGPLLVLTGLILISEIRQARRAAARVMTGGLAALVVAIGMEAATPVLFALGFDHGTVPYELESVIEEGLELAGFVLIATGLAARAVDALTETG